MFNNCFDDLQVTDRRPLTTEDRVHSQPSLCQICGEQEWHLDMFFSQYFRFPPFRNIPPILHTLNISLIGRTSGRSLGTFRQSIVLPETGQHRTGKHSHAVLFRFRTVNLSLIVTPP